MSKSSIRVKDNGLDAFMKRAQDLARLRSAKVKVGVLASGKGGAKEEGADLTVAEIAAILHYGTQDGRIPPRPFLTLTVDAKRGELKALGAKLMAGVIFGEMPLNQALNLMGAYLAAETKKTITAGVKPDNAPSTLRRKQAKGNKKGGVKPLIDTGRLLGAISWAIDTGK